MELGLEGPGPELHCHEAAAGVGSGRLRICAPVRAGQRPCTHLSRVGCTPSSPSGLEEVPAPLSSHQRSKEVGKGRQEQRALPASPGSSGPRSLCQHEKAPLPSSEAARPAPTPTAARARGRGTLLSQARISGTSERQESPLGERGTKEPQADAFETKFICLPRAPASRWGRTGAAAGV